MASSPYCPSCGEKRIDRRDQTLGHYLGAAVEGLINLDSRLWRTLRSFAMRPGELTRLYTNGVRKPYVQPFVLLLYSILFVLAVGQVIEYRLFTTNLATQVGGSLHGDWALEVARAQASRLGLGLDEYEARYNATTQQLSKPVLLLLVPLAALLSIVMLLPRKLSAQGHFVLATHFIAWFVVFPGFLLAIVAIAAAQLLARAHVPIPDLWLREAPILAVLIAGTCWWLASAQARLFASSRTERWTRALPWTLLFLFTGGSLMRLALFLATVAVLRG